MKTIQIDDMSLQQITEAIDMANLYSEAMEIPEDLVILETESILTRADELRWREWELNMAESLVARKNAPPRKFENWTDGAKRNWIEKLNAELEDS